MVGTSTTDPPPAMVGGTIADGTYVLTSNIAYGNHSADEKKRQRTVRFEAGTLQVINSDNGGGDLQATFSVTFEGNTMTQTPTCPDFVPAQTVIYTTTATGFISAKDVEESYQIYVKQ